MKIELPIAGTWTPIYTGRNTHVTSHRFLQLVPLLTSVNEDPGVSDYLCVCVCVCLFDFVSVCEWFFENELLDIGSGRTDLTPSAPLSAPFLQYRSPWSTPIVLLKRA